MEMSQQNPLYNYHTNKNILNKGQEGKTGTVWWWAPVGERRV
jgi:hypothetical protein